MEHLRNAGNQIDVPQAFCLELNIQLAKAQKNGIIGSENVLSYFLNYSSYIAVNGICSLFEDFFPFGNSLSYVNSSIRLDAWNLPRSWKRREIFFIAAEVI